MEKREPSPPGPGTSIHYLLVEVDTFEAILAGKVRTFTLWDRANPEVGDMLRICTKRRGINCQATAYITEVTSDGRHCSGEFSFEKPDGDRR